jgi:cell filamentation protein
MSRYDLPGGDEAEFEPGSNRLVLRNIAGITDVRGMDVAEAIGYRDMIVTSMLELETDQRFTATFIRDLHRRWLGGLYSFAGEYRTVDISKGILFCRAEFVAREMDRFEREGLAANTPCEGVSFDTLHEPLAAVHAEFILIHPFREGNGRLGRWIASMMALQAGFPMLSFHLEQRDEQAREDYFAALRKGFGSDLKPLEAWFRGVLDRSWAIAQTQTRGF